ncbi:MAG: helix-turn-helix domain-containing protein [bacterium]
MTGHSSETPSKRASALLRRQEGYDVEFKKSRGHVDAQDIVAFAHSPTGDAILVGVEENKDSSGRQIGVVHGCSVGDRAKQSIISRAENCVPPVEIAIHTERDNGHVFFRVEIPSGQHKPYCTGGGTYKIRGDGRSKPLVPSKLLYIFIEAEGDEFVERFRNATKGLENDLAETRARLVQQTKSLADTVELMERGVSRSLGEIFRSAEDTKALSDDAMMFSDEAVGGLQEVLRRLDRVERQEIDWILEKVDALLVHFDIEDPRMREARQVVEMLTKKYYDEGLKEQEMAENFSRLWEAGGIAAPYPEVGKWHRNKLDELSRESDRDPT